jgi:cytochrome b561
MTDTRYRPALRRLHWLMAVLVLLAYVAIEQRSLFPRGSDARAAMVQSHFWLGLAIFVLAAWRLALRRRVFVPPVVPALSPWQLALSRTLHVALYAFFIAQPLLGLATAWSDGKQVLLPLAGIALPALLPANDALAHTLEDVHRTIGTAFYFVIGLHVAAAAWHHFVRRDDALKRML